MGNATGGSRRAASPDRDGSARSKDEDGAVDAMIDELVANVAELAAVAHDNARMLTTLLSEREAGIGASPRLPADVAALVALAAPATGMTTEEYVREAVLEYSARDGAGKDGDHRAGLGAARREAHRIRAESHAVAAQSARAMKQSEDVMARANAARRPARRTEDPDGDRGAAG